MPVLHNCKLLFFLYIYFLCVKFLLFYRHPSTPVETTPIKTTNKVLRTSAKLNNNNNNNNTSKKNSTPPSGKRSTRTSNGKIVKKQKLTQEPNTNNVATFGNNDYENKQLPRDPWLLSTTKSIKPEDTKVGVVLRSSGKIPKIWKCNNNAKEVSTTPKIKTLPKIKTPLSEPMTRILRSHKKYGSKRFRNVASRSSWSPGMVTRSHRKKVKH